MGSCLATYFKPNQQGTRGTRYKRVPTDSTRTTYGTSNRDQASGGATSQRGNDETPSSAAKCEACGLSFNTKTELSVHIASTHGGNIQKQVTRKRKKEKEERRRQEERTNLYKDIRNGGGSSDPKETTESPAKISRWSQSKNYIKSKISKVKLPPRERVENYVESLLRDKPKTVNYAARAASQQTAGKKKKKKKKKKTKVKG